MSVKVEDLLKMSGRKRRKILEDYISSMHHFTHKTQMLYLGVVKSLLRFYRKPTQLSVKIHGVNRTPTLKDERIPEPEGAREVLNRLETRTKISAALIAFAGIRFGTQVKLKLEDLFDTILTSVLNQQQKPPIGIY